MKRRRAEKEESLFTPPPREVRGSLRGPACDGGAPLRAKWRTRGEEERERGELKVVVGNKNNNQVHFNHFRRRPNTKQFN
jgi:hypothetical protein